MNDRWYVYVILCDDGSLYKGYTDNLERCYKQHCNAQGAIHTRLHKPIKIVYYEKLQTQTDAIAREKYLKSGSGREWPKKTLQEGGSNEQIR